jgi:hypothetical protein
VKGRAYNQNLLWMDAELPAHTEQGSEESFWPGWGWKKRLAGAEQPSQVMNQFHDRNKQTPPPSIHVLMKAVLYLVSPRESN